MANSKEYVVHGATLKCTMGNKSTTLRVSNNRKYTMKGKKVATIMDFMPGVNMLPPVGTFGICKPYSAVPPPGNLCTLIPVGPWKMVYALKSIGLLRPLLGNSCLMCGRGGGVITIKKTGQ